MRGHCDSRRNDRQLVQITSGGGYIVTFIAFAILFLALRDEDNKRKKESSGDE